MVVPQRLATFSTRIVLPANELNLTSLPARSTADKSKKDEAEEKVRNRPRIDGPLLVKAAMLNRRYRKRVKIHLHEVGFEPTSENTLELESSPLDQLGHSCLIDGQMIFCKLYQKSIMVVLRRNTSQTVN